MKNILLHLTVYLTMALLLFACEVNKKDKTAAEGEETADTGEVEHLDDALVKLFESLEQQAEKALDGEELVQARQLVDKGLHRTQKAGRKYELYEARFALLKGKLEHLQGSTGEARRFFGDAMAIFRIRKNMPGTFEVRLAQATLEETGGDFAAAQRELDEAKKLLPKIESINLKVEFTFKQAELFASQMKHQDAARLFLEAAEQFHANKNQSREADAYVALAACEEAQEKPLQSKNILNKAYKIYLAAKDKEGAVKALHRLAQFSVREEKYKTAREQFKQVEALYLQLGRQSDATKVNQHISALPE
jgi:hypothetical protein